jgi:hypothetical protein
MARGEENDTMTETFADRYHARRAEAARAEAQSDAIYGACCRAVARAMSDHAGGYRICPAKACRPARRCIEDPVRCRELIEPLPLSWIDESFLIDDVYNDTLRQLARGAARR